MPIRVLIVTGTPYARGRLDGGRQDHPKPVPLVRQRRSPALAGDLGYRAAEVQVDVINAVLVAQDLGGVAP